MTESGYTQLVVKALRQHRPKAVTFKFADLYTMGVPDFMMSIGGTDSWFEAKKLDISAVSEVGARFYAIVRPKYHVPAVQWETLRRLMRGHLIIYTDRGHAMTHVTGMRDSVETMRLELVDLKGLVRRIITVAEQSEKYGGYDNSI